MVSRHDFNDSTRGCQRSVLCYIEAVYSRSTRLPQRIGDALCAALLNLVRHRGYPPYGHRECK
jgi:hypothetical protein